MKYFLLRVVRLHLLLLAFSLYLPASSQTVKEEWARRYSGSIPSQESSVHLAVDDEGNSYVTGNSASVNATSETEKHIVVAKFSPSGEELWASRSIGPMGREATGIAVDDAGDVYVVGSDEPTGPTRGSLLVLKYSGADGSLLWSKSQDSFIGSRGSQIAVAEGESVYIIGNALLSFPIYFLSKFNASDGKPVWTKIINMSDNQSDFTSLLQPPSVAVNASGDVFVSGATSEGEVITSRYRASDGERQWSQSFDSGQKDTLRDLALDSAGGVYITGSSFASSSAEPAESFLIKYQATNGEQVWQKQIVSRAGASNLITDNTGGLYLTGNIFGMAQILKYRAADGEADWIAPFSGRVTHLAVDNTGGVYAGGTTPDVDYVVRKYHTSTGEIAWQASSNEDGVEDKLIALKVSEVGSVSVAGIRTVSANLNTAVFVAGHQSNVGAQQWKSVFEGELPTIDTPVSIATDTEGNIIVSGVTSATGVGNTDTNISTIKYSPEGQVLWVSQLIQEFRDDVVDLAVDDAGDVYIVGTSLGGVGGDGRPDLVLLKYNGTTGDLIWDAVYGPGQANFGMEIKLDRQGNIFITGLANSMFDVRSMEFLFKIDAETGEFVWGKRYSSEIANAELDDLVNFVLDEAGDVYVTGTLAGGIIAGDIVTLKYDGQGGEKLWTKTYDSGLQDRVTGLAVDDTGDVYLIGFSDLSPENRIAFLIKYQASDGEQLGFEQLVNQGVGITGVNSLQIGALNGVYLAGFINGTPHVIKYDADELGLLWASPYEGVLATLTTDETAGVYVSSVVDEQILTAKYNALDGRKVWEVVKESRTQNALVAIDKDQNVLVAGTVFGPATNSDILTTKYSQKQDTCNIPVTVKLYLPPMAKRVGWQVRTTADFGTYTLTDETGVRWTWGEGIEPTIAYTAFGNPRITGEHTYQQAGIYKIGLDFSKSCLTASNTDFEQWIPIFDPEAGTVNGEGSMQSESGSLGFSFDVAYGHRYNTAPQVWHAHFTIEGVGELRSGSVQWLVVRGNKAAWEGEGTLNGTGYYGFMASVTDAGGAGPDDTGDRLRLRIWDKGRYNRLVYDSFAEGGEILDLANQGPAIEKGNIIIKGNSEAAAASPMQLEAYPNTFSDRTVITFSMDQAQQYRIDVYDMRGNLVQHLAEGTVEAKKEYTFELDGTALNEGLYIARLVTGTGSKSIKVLLKR